MEISVLTPQSQMLRLWVTGAVRCENGQIRMCARTVAVESYGRRDIFGHFYSARNARSASAVLATAIPSVRLSVCLSVRPSHPGIVSK